MPHPRAGTDRPQEPDFRRPILPAPLERIELEIPGLPEALEGFRILHLTDLHLRKGRPVPPTIASLIEHLPAYPVDLVCLTGDYGHLPGDEAAACEGVGRLSKTWRSRLGALGIFGNHDSRDLPAMMRERVPGVRWLGHETIALAPGLRALATTYPEDALAAMPAAMPAAATADFTLALIHYPTEAITLGALGVPLALAGHTHGGQMRLSPEYAPHTSCDLPHDQAAGLLRFGPTRVAISRGLGQSVVELRLNCAPQAPIYVLRRGPAEGAPSPPTGFVKLVSW
jgi:predicted MPP superfamily phosphohydrolase